MKRVEVKASASSSQELRFVGDRMEKSRVGGRSGSGMVLNFGFTGTISMGSPRRWMICCLARTALEEITAQSRLVDGFTIFAVLEGSENVRKRRRYAKRGMLEEERKHRVVT